MQDKTLKKSGWQIDKHINISVLIVVMIQFIGFVYWVSTIDHVTSNNTTRLSKLEHWKYETIKDNSALIQRITSTESGVKNLQSQTHRIERKLDRALERIK